MFNFQSTPKLRGGQPPNPLLGSIFPLFKFLSDSIGIMQGIYCKLLFIIINPHLIWTQYLHYIYYDINHSGEWIGQQRGWGIGEWCWTQTSLISGRNKMYLQIYVTFDKPCNQTSIFLRDVRTLSPGDFKIGRWFWRHLFYIYVFLYSSVYFEMKGFQGDLEGVLGGFKGVLGVILNVSVIRNVKVNWHTVVSDR